MLAKIYLLLIFSILVPIYTISILVDELQLLICNQIHIE